MGRAFRGGAKADLFRLRRPQHNKGCKSRPPYGPPENATTVRVDRGKTLTTDGPFVGMKEAVGGFFVLEAENLDAAIEVAARCPGSPPRRCDRDPTCGDVLEVAAIDRVFRVEWGRVLSTRSASSAISTSPRKPRRRPLRLRPSAGPETASPAISAPGS